MRDRHYLLPLLLCVACEASAGPAMQLRDASVLPVTDGAVARLADGGACPPARQQAFEIGSAAHVAAPDYGTDLPPAGGPHTSCWVDYDVYDSEVDPGRWVHNLEHGAVVLLYRCDGDCQTEQDGQDERAALEGFVRDHGRTLLSPYAKLPTRFAVVAWGHRLLMDCLDMDAVDAFYRAHFNDAPENVASGAPLGC